MPSKDKPHHEPKKPKQKHEPLPPQQAATPGRLPLNLSHPQAHPRKPSSAREY